MRREALAEPDRLTEVPVPLVREDELQRDVAGGSVEPEGRLIGSRQPRPRPDRLIERIEPTINADCLGERISFDERQRLLLVATESRPRSTRLAERCEPLAYLNDLGRGVRK